LSVQRLVLNGIYIRVMKKQKIMIAGPKNELLKTAFYMASNKYSTYVITYLYDTCRGIKNFEKYIEKVDDVIICSDIDQGLKNIILSICSGRNKRVYVVPEVYDISLMKPRLTQIDDTPYLYLDNTGISKELLNLKRLFDIILSVLIIIFTSPLMLTCTLMVRLDSPGRVFFLQERVTLNGRVFKVIKFRTMMNGAEDKTGAVLSKENDQRVTRAGKILRSTRMDELPQFFNVLAGHMSIIGPRPERPVFVGEYIASIPLYDKRHSIKAGITGLAQIMGKYSTTPRDKLRYDLIYIQNYSFLLDIKIFFLTIKTMFLEMGSSWTDSNIDYEAELGRYNIPYITD
jgi:exopolysaccharide biosynthesis polyprenyl glycosylphosphotransferase